MKNSKLLFMTLFFTLVIFENAVCQPNEIWYPGNYQNFGFTSYKLLQQAEPVKVNTNIIATDVHVFYIGANRKVCDYVWNGLAWMGGIQLEWTPNYVQSKTQLCNNGNELFFIREADNKICHLYYNSTGWHVDVISKIPARTGTDLVYSNNVIYYVGFSNDPVFNNKICYVSRPTANQGFSINKALSTTTSFNVLENTQIIYVGSNTSTTAEHVYYIGDSHKVYDIVKSNGVWTGSTNSLAYNIAGLPIVRIGSDLTNNENQIFYIGDDNKLYELQWTLGTGWTGSLVMSNAQDILNPSPIKYFDNHVYYIGGSNSRLSDVFYDGSIWCCTGSPGQDPVLPNSKFSVYKGSTGHVIYTIGTDNFVNITLWDDKVCDFELGLDRCSDPSCLGATWHNGGLNILTHNAASDWSNIAGAVGMTAINAIPKKFFYVDQSGFVNIFLRSINNDVNKIGWNLTFQDEFNDLLLTKQNWDNQGPWSHGHELSTDPQEALWNSRQYPTTDWSNWSENYGIGIIETRQETTPYSGLTWGWATSYNNPGNFCGPLNYEYTGAMLCTGGINVDYDCADPWVDPDQSYCTCRFITPNSCEFGFMVNTCDIHVDRYSGPCYPPMSVPKFQQRYGWFEMRCKVPAGKNMWSAFWSLNKGAGHSENDFFEIDGDGKTMLSNIYYEDCYIDQPKDLPGGIHFKNYAVGYRFYDDYYTFACEWGPAYTRYYLNNELIGETTDDGALMQTDEKFLLVNNYVMDAVGRCMSPNFPNYFEIDYVRVYQNPNWRLSHNSETVKNNVNPANQIILQPTMVTDMVNIKFVNENKGIAVIEVFNTVGMLVSSQSKSWANNSDIQIDLSTLPEGMYSINVLYGSVKEVFKIIKM